MKKLLITVIMFIMLTGCAGLNLNKIKPLDTKQIDTMYTLVYNIASLPSIQTRLSDRDKAVLFAMDDEYNKHIGYLKDLESTKTDQEVIDTLLLIGNDACNLLLANPDITEDNKQLIIDIQTAITVLKLTGLI